VAIQDYLQASGQRILAGVEGIVHNELGEINISNRAINGVDENLMKLLMAASDELKLYLNINSIDTGAHVPASRHYHGCAVDVNHIGDMDDPARPQATISNRLAVDLLHLLISSGFTAGHENGDYPAVLFGPCGTAWNKTALDHSTHMHISLHPKPGE
jgi:hypothetical protein